MQKFCFAKFLSRLFKSKTTREKLLKEREMRLYENEEEKIARDLRANRKPSPVTRLSDDDITAEYVAALADVWFYHANNKRLSDNPMPDIIDIIRPPDAVFKKWTPLSDDEIDAFIEESKRMGHPEVGRTRRTSTRTNGNGHLSENNSGGGLRVGQTGKSSYVRLRRSPLTWEKAHAIFVDTIDTLPEYRQAASDLGITIQQLKDRMTARRDYDPVDNPDVDWYEGCNPEYATMSEPLRDERFIEAVSRWLWPVPWAYSSYIKKVLSTARILADEAGALYEDWVMAQYWALGEKKITYSVLASSMAVSRYARWKDRGSPKPENRGSLFLRNLREAKRTPGGRKGPAVSCLSSPNQKTLDKARALASTFNFANIGKKEG
mgnify:CR=1 FL=1